MSSTAIFVASESCATLCPLCGQPNGCAIEAARAQGGKAEAASTGGALECWCATQPIPAAVLARVPTAARGQACICQHCAQGKGV